MYTQNQPINQSLISVQKIYTCVYSCNLIHNSTQQRTMPLTPRFSLDQNSSHVILTVRIPYIRPSDAELRVEPVSSSSLASEKTDVSFYCKPYLLRLRLPAALCDEDGNKAVYNPDEERGTLTVHLKKINESFIPDLDLISKLMIPPAHEDELFLKKEQSQPNIIELNSKRAETEEKSKVISSFEDNENEVDWRNILASNNKNGDKKYSYGFMDQHSNIFSKWNEQGENTSSYTYLQREMGVELPNPDVVPRFERRSMRLISEEEAFDAERYIGDYFGATDDILFTMAMDSNCFIPHWEKYINRVDDLIDGLNGLSTSDVDTKCHFTKFTEEDNLRLSRLPRCNFTLNHTDNWRHLLSLVDIIAAYVYDCRLTCNDPNPESAWTIAILSPTLSWFESYESDKDSPYDALVFSLRRMMIYPYLRYWPFALKILDDVKKIFTRGKRCVLRCLLQIHDTFEHTDTHYLLNKLYISDYCSWIQSVSDSSFADFTTELKKSCSMITKDCVNLDLTEFEKYAMKFK